MRAFPRRDRGPQTGESGQRDRRHTAQRDRLDLRQGRASPSRWQRRVKFLTTSATRLVSAANGNTAGIVGAARVSKRGRGFRKHQQSRATAGRSQAYQWMEPLTKSAVSAITTIRARTPTTVRAAFER